MATPRCALFATIALPFLAGCGEQHFRAETVWHPDGRIERAVYQPAEFFPESARKGWEAVRQAGEVRSDEFSGSIRVLPDDAGDDPRHVAAWGTFLSPDRIPEHVTFQVSDFTFRGRLERSVEINRLGFVTEYVWRERLADVVSLADMQTARRETVDLLSGLIETTLCEAAPEYRTADLLAWLRTDAAAWLDEAHASFVEAALRRELKGDSGKLVAARLADISAKYGLVLWEQPGKLVEGSALDDAVDKFLVAKVRETVRTADDGRLDEPEARRFLAKLGITWDGSAMTWQPSEPWRRAVISRFGTEEAASAKATDLGARLFGAYQAGMFPPGRPFRYEMTVPGSVVETTGQRLADNRVLWQFDAAEAFPLGYDMTVRSLAPNDAAQTAALGSARLKTLDQLAEYAALLKADAALPALMERSIAAGSLNPLDDYLAEISTQSGTDPSVLARLTRLRKLLSP